MGNHLADGEFAANMEAVLKTYEKPYDPANPVLCMDELWYKELEAAAAEIDPEDDQRLLDATTEVRRQAKEIARREMGLA